MKGRNDPLAQVLWWLYVASRLLFVIICVSIDISLHLSALVCVYQHWTALAGKGLNETYLHVFLCMDCFS